MNVGAFLSVCYNIVGRQTNVNSCPTRWPSTPLAPRLSGGRWRAESFHHQGGVYEPPSSETSSTHPAAGTKTTLVEPSWGNLARGRRRGCGKGRPRRPGFPCGGCQLLKPLCKQNNKRKSKRLSHLWRKSLIFLISSPCWSEPSPFTS